MKREIVINASALECRVALLEDNSLSEFYLEREQRGIMVGNIYKGKVTRVLPGMQAAFVDIGLEKAGFLHVSDFLGGIDAFGSTAEAMGEEIETEPVAGNDGAGSDSEAEALIAEEEPASDQPQGRGRRRRRRPPVPRRLKLPI